jgi:hypothetical protein
VVWRTDLISDSEPTQNSNPHSSPNKIQKRKERRKRRKQRRKNRLTPQIGRIRCTHTTVDVQWQDGTLTKGLPATSLVPHHHIQDTEYWPEDFVILKPISGLSSSHTFLSFFFWNPIEKDVLISRSCVSE